MTYEHELKHQVIKSIGFAQSKGFEIGVDHGKVGEILRVEVSIMFIIKIVAIDLTGLLIIKAEDQYGEQPFKMWKNLL